MARPSKFVMPASEYRELARQKRAQSAPVARDVGEDLAEETAEATPSAGESFSIPNVPMSDAGEDRARDTIAAEGWRLENFAANPILLWCHNYSEPPIGSVEGAAVKDGVLRAGRVVFATEDLNPFGAMMGRMYAAKLLKGFSIGMLPLKWAWNEERGGVDFLEQELLELSACPVPMNPRILAGAKSMGLPVHLLLERAEKYLDGDAHAPEWLSAEEAVLIHRTFRAPRVQVPARPVLPRAFPTPQPAPPTPPLHSTEAFQRALAEEVVRATKEAMFRISGLMPG